MCEVYIICDPLMCKKNYPRLIVSNQMVEVFSIQKVKTFSLFVVYESLRGLGAQVLYQKGCLEKVLIYRNDVLENI